MTREQKIKKRTERAEKRRAQRMAKYVKRIEGLRNLIASTEMSYAEARNMPLSLIGKDGEHTGAPWYDKKSRTKWSQVCSYMGICEYPCNGDC
jgi:hypothetical protein